MPNSRSNAELLLEEQLRQAGIPYRREFAFAAPQRRWRADFVVAGPDWDFRHGYYSLLVEIDGGAFLPGGGRHTRGKGFANDAEKASAAAILGYRVIRCVPEQVEDGRCLSWIKAALGIGEAAA